MKYTLLEMTQDVLSSMDGDEVNSITDNTEAMQIARIIRSCYFDILSTELPEATNIFHLEASGDDTKPVLMTTPEDVHTVQLIKYNKIEADESDPNWVTLFPLSMSDFFHLTHALRLSEDNVASMSVTLDGDDISFLYRNDVAPTYYTSPDNHTFIFDSYDVGVDTTLQRSKTFCVGEKETTFVLEDDHEIDLQERQHIWLLNEAKALAFQELKQMVNQKAEQTAKRQRIRSQRQKHISNDHSLYYNNLAIYGRRGKAHSTPSLIMH